MEQSPDAISNYNAGAHYVRGLNHSQNGQYDLAIADFSEAIRLEPYMGEAYSGRGWVHLRNGKYDLKRAEAYREMTDSDAVQAGQTTQ